MKATAGGLILMMIHGDRVLRTLGDRKERFVSYT